MISKFIALALTLTTANALCANSCSGHGKFFIFFFSLVSQRHHLPIPMDTFHPSHHPGARFIKKKQLLTDLSLYPTSSPFLFSPHTLSFFHVHLSQVSAVSMTSALATPTGRATTALIALALLQNHGVTLRTDTTQHTTTLNAPRRVLVIARRESASALTATPVTHVAASIAQTHALDMGSVAQRPRWPRIPPSVSSSPPLVQNLTRASCPVPLPTDCGTPRRRARAPVTQVTVVSTVPTCFARVVMIL